MQDKNVIPIDTAIKKAQDKMINADWNRCESYSYWMREYKRLTHLKDDGQEWDIRF